MTPETRELLAFSVAARDQTGRETIALLFLMSIAAALIVAGAMRDSWRLTGAGILIGGSAMAFFAVTGHRRRREWDELFAKAMEREHHDS